MTFIYSKLAVAITAHEKEMKKNILVYMTDVDNLWWKEDIYELRVRECGN